MTKIRARHYSANGKANIVVLGPNGLLQADSFHPHWPAITEALANDDERIYDLFDVKVGLGRRLEMLSERVSYDGENIRFDGTAIHSVLADQIKRALETNEADYMPLVRFWEKLESNPLEHSKEQAYRWLSTHDFQVTEDGDVVGYKGVQLHANGTMTSIHAGPANVDGQPVNGYVPNAIGSVITMPRDEVKHDPNVACHRGLHVGDWSYASHFARGAVLEVHVNPRDIVSVPNDSYSRKVRTCRYKVVSVVTSQYEGGPVLRPEGISETWAEVGYAGY